MKRIRLTGLARDEQGSAVIEFALLAPAIIAMMLGVLHVGIALQNYHALRNASADVARYAMVQYATGNILTDTQLRNYTLSISSGAPYILTPGRLNASISNAATQRVSGATEKSLTMIYQVPTLFDSMGLRGPSITYTRPVFLTTPDT